MENNIKNNATENKAFAEIAENTFVGKSNYFKEFFNKNFNNEGSLEEMFEELEKLHTRYNDGELMATEVFGNIIHTVFETRDAMMLVYKKRVEWLENFGDGFDCNKNVFKTEVKNEETSNEVLSARDEAIKNYINKYAPKFNLVVNSEDFKLNGRGYVFTKELCEDFLKKAFCDYITSKGYVVEVFTRTCGVGYTYTIKLA